MTGSMRFQSGLQELLTGEFDENFLRPSGAAIGAAEAMVDEAVGDAECPAFHLSALGDGGIRLHCGMAPGRQFILSVPSDDGDGMPYIYHDGDGLSGLTGDVDIEELRRRFGWVGEMGG